MTYNPQRETDHEGSGLSKLLEQYQRADRLRALLAPWLRQIQILEDTAWDVLAKRFDRTGAGILLDWLGKIVGARPRGGLSDPEYLRVIQAQIIANRASGREGELSLVLRLTLASGFVYTYRDEPPAAFAIDLRDGVAPILPVLRAVLRMLKPAGVRLLAIYRPEDVTHETDFRFADADDPDPDDLSPHGFADAGGVPGGGRYVSAFAI